MKHGPYNVKLWQVFWTVAFPFRILSNSSFT
jgi:hypothetical protein